MHELESPGSRARINFLFMLAASICVYRIRNFLSQQPPSGLRPPRYQGFPITHRHTTLAGLLWTSDQPLRRDLYLKKNHNTQKRQISMPSAGFEPATPASEWPQAHTISRAAAGTGPTHVMVTLCMNAWNFSFFFNYANFPRKSSTTQNCKFILNV